MQAILKVSMAVVRVLIRGDVGAVAQVTEGVGRADVGCRRMRMRMRMRRNRRGESIGWCNLWW